MFLSPILCGLLAGVSAASTQDGEPARVVELDEPLRVSRAEGLLPVTVPRGEELRFGVFLHLGPLGDPMAGEFTLTSGVDPFLRGLPLPGSRLSQGDLLEAGWLRTRATGLALGYRLDHRIEVRLLPQDWPALLYTDSQVGSENRRRELRLGRIDGVETARSRRDHHCDGCDRAEHLVKGIWPYHKVHHCDDCGRSEHRVWGGEKEREIPLGVVDMLSAIYMSRSMADAGLERISFAVLDKLDLWNTELSLGERRVLQTPAGAFSCRRVVMESTSADDADEEDFSGLFGIHGEIGVWVHDPTGVPVRITGAVPLGPFDLRVTIDLRSFSGTPPGFAPLVE